MNILPRFGWIDDAKAAKTIQYIFIQRSELRFEHLMSYAANI